MRITSLLTAVLALSTSTTWADTITVCWDGSGNHTTIQAGIDAASNGDEVVVCPGTYNEVINFLGKAITVHSSEGTETTIIDGTGLNDSVVKCVSGEGPDTMLEGFTITGGTGDPDFWVDAVVGGGMLIQGSSPTVVDCLFQGNSVTGQPYAGGMGGAIYSDDSSPTISSCIFDGNFASGNGGGLSSSSGDPEITDCSFTNNHTIGQGGGALLRGGGPLATHCIFTNNIADDWGGALAVHYCGTSSVSILNCVFSGNTATLGSGGLYFGQNPGLIDVTNCTISGNVPCGIDYSGEGSLYIANTIVWGNAVDVCGVPTFAYSNIQGGFPGTGNIDADPLFVDPNNGDFRLSSCSPGIDGGDNTVPNLPTTDLDGDPRLVDDAGVADTGNGSPPVVDMGAYERQIDSVLTIINVPADQPTIQEAINAAPAACAEVVVAPGTYNEVINFLGKAITLRSSDGPDVTTIDGTGLNDSVVKCISGEGPDTVLEGFTITGGTGDPTVFPGYTVGGGMYNNGSSPTVTNCLFSANTVNNDPSGDMGGGGMYNVNSGHPTLTECTFSGNTGSFGGAMYNGSNSSPTLVNCLFSVNSAVAPGGFGGGMYNSIGANPKLTGCTFSVNTAVEYGSGLHSFSTSGVTLINCTFRNNSAWVGSGPALVANCRFIGNTATSNTARLSFYQSTTPLLVNCTFVDNATAIGNTINADDCDLTVSNCIVWGNSGGFGVGTGSLLVNYSNVQGGWPGTGNIDADPLFIDPNNGDYRLDVGSPCIDAGDNTAVPSDIVDLDGDGDTTERTPFDLDGNPRFVDAAPPGGTGVPDPPDYPEIVDMGPYERFQDCNGNGISDSLDMTDCDGSPWCGDCDDNGVLDECDLDPNDPDGDGNVAPDCNANLIPDDCDIANGVSEDCNANGVLDECDLDPNDPDGDGNVAPDCNGNLIPDDCDIDPNDPDGDGKVWQDYFQRDASGLLCVADGVPDECQCMGDIAGTGDGLVSLSDLALLLASYGRCTADPDYDCITDLNGDGCVDLSDLAGLLARYDTTCP